MPTWREIRGAYGRRRRALRQAMLEPVLVGWPVLRDVVMNALAARGHLVLCELGDVRFFVDPSDRVVGAWLMWHGGWQRREIDAAVDVLSAAQRLPANAVFVDVGAHIGTHTIYALRTGRFARAVAFEPAPRNADLLARNLEANGLSQAAVIVPKAAGAAPGTAVLHLHPRNTGAHAIGEPPSVDGQARLDVPVVRVDDELARLGVPLEAVGLAWMPSLCSIETQLTSLRSPRLPSSLTRNFGTKNSDMPFTPSGAFGVRASTKWMMLSARSCSPKLMKIFCPRMR